MELTRREFLESTLKAAAGTPLFSLDDWLKIDALSSIKYGFTTAVTAARREPDFRATSFATYPTGALLRFSQTLEDPDQQWWQVVHDTRITNPRADLAHGDIFVPRARVKLLEPSDLAPIHPQIPVREKRIEINLRKRQKLVAYEGSRVHLTTLVTAGLNDWTRVGEFEIQWVTLSRLMQSLVYGYTIPGVPFVQNITDDGIALHGAYWRDKFGNPGSHGCINLPIPKAQELYRWAPVGTRVSISY